MANEELLEQEYFNQPIEFNDQLLKDKYFTEAIEKIKAIVSIPSFSGSATKDAPYGGAVKEVLHYALNLAKSLGFKTYCDPENKYGYVEYGQGAEIFAILGHLDVVPPGNLDEWKVPPFKPEIINNILYGRGVLDDKGPTIINLYCLKYLKDHNYQPKRRIRLIFGLTEETSWDSIKTYMAKEGTPTFGYTPDGLFPLTYAEKGIINIDINGPGYDAVKILGGNAYNVTCSTTTISDLTAENLDKFYQIALDKGYRIEKQDKEIIIHGKPAHGSKPNEGINAGLRALLVLKELGFDHPLINFVADVLQEDTVLIEHFGQYDDESGGFTFNVGIIEINEQFSRLSCNIRFPVLTKQAVILNKLQTLLAPYHLTTAIEHYDKPLYMALDSPLVTKLMTIYKTVTQDQTAKPIAIGGGTYARSMPNCVAFGAIFDDSISTEHQYNEAISLKDLWQSMLIYVRAISSLGNLDHI
ncbi:MAG: Sapep family Mn(2+)-dependent dipeptidase [Spiroplasma sp.]|nr:Sapep family Mn(2+)-dependent dipeptidase [Spiroplasma sp.]